MTSSRALKFADDGYATLYKVADFLMINFSLSVLLSWLGKTETAVDVAAAFIFSMVFLVVGQSAQLYRNDVIRRIDASIVRLILVTVLSIFLMAIARYVFAGMEGVNISNLTVSVFNTWCLVIFSVAAMLRLLVIRCSHVLRNVGDAKKRIAIIGMTPAGLAISNSIHKDNQNQTMDVAFYDDRDEDRFGYMNSVPHLGEVQLALDKARDGELDEVYIALPMVAKDRIRQYLDALSNSTVDTFIVPDLYTYNLNVSQVKSVGGVQTFSVFGSPFDGVGALIKRIEDIIIGSAITLMISPVLIAVAIGVKLSSPGPVLFKQDRYGLGGKKIKVWKFRSMKVMENSAVVTQATKNDPRVTKFGAFIRRTSLDELPQFFNVIQGTMSIVGPRPHAVAHNEEYRVLVDNYMVRHKIKPGITGWAQINGYRGETETVDKMEKRIQFDIQYMQKWTLWLDLKIIFLTIFKGFVSETAY